MLVKILEPFSAIDIDLSPRTGQVIEIVDERRANKLIEAGLVKQVESIIPEGSITVTKNGTKDVSAYAKVKIDVKAWRVEIKNKIENLDQYQSHILAISNGDTIIQDIIDNLQFTIPEGKEIIGISRKENSEVAEIIFPVEITKNETFYIITGDEED